MTLFIGVGKIVSSLYKKHLIVRNNKNLTKQYFCVILVKIQFEVLLWTHIFSKILIWI